MLNKWNEGFNYMNVLITHYLPAILGV